MTEWTFDLVEPAAEIDDAVDLQDAAPVAPAATDRLPYQDVDADAVTDDIIELELVDWFA